MTENETAAGLSIGASATATTSSVGVCTMGTAATSCSNRKIVSVHTLHLGTKSASEEIVRKKRMAKKFGNKQKMSFPQKTILPPITNKAGTALSGSPASLVSKEDKNRVPEHPNLTKSFTLDGFLLVEAGHVEFPDELDLVDLSGKRLREVVPQDLEFFARLKMIDLGENELTLEQLVTFPSLEELHLYCNNLRSIPATLPSGAFRTVRVLNLSYNLLTCEALEGIVQLENLEQLDLVGNDIEDVPKSMVKLESLEILNLSSNRMRSPSSWHVLAALPALRELNVSSNEFSGIPLASKDAFAKLEWISLANNKIGDEADLKGLMPCKKLFCIVLYGNPLTTEFACCRSEVSINNQIVTLVIDPPPSESSLQTHGKALGKRVLPGKKGAMHTGTYTSFRISKLLQRPVSKRRGKPLSPLDRLRASRSHNMNGTEKSESGAKTKAKSTIGGRRHPQQPPSPTKGKKLLRGGIESTTAVTTATATSAVPSFADTIRLKLSVMASRGDPVKDPSQFRSAMSEIRTALQHTLSTSAEFQLKGHGFEKNTVSWSKKAKAPLKNFEASLKKEDKDFDLTIVSAKAKSSEMLKNVEAALADLDTATAPSGT
eukprot:g2491.t1